MTSKGIHAVLDALHAVFHPAGHVFQHLGDPLALLRIHKQTVSRQPRNRN